MKKIKTPNRVCEICSNEFSRPAQYPIDKFLTKRTCSKECFKVLLRGNVCGFQKGHKPFSEKGRFQKGNMAWNKGKHIRLNNSLDKWRKNGGVVYNKGKKLSPETIEKIKTKRALQVGAGFQKKEKHWNWKGGRTALRKQVQQTYLYRQWRKSVFERDNYTCQECGITGTTLNADHIKPYSKIISENKIETVEQAKMCLELWNILNGRTLCVACHKNTETYGGKSINLA